VKLGEILKEEKFLLVRREHVVKRVRTKMMIKPFNIFKQSQF